MLYSFIRSRKFNNFLILILLAEPIVDEVMKENNDKEFILVHVAVGSREEYVFQI